jgi:hypothetical protein
MKAYFKRVVKQEFEILSEPITDKTIVETWVISQTRCDHCGFELDDSFTTALRLQSGKKMIIHNDCLARMQKELGDEI